MMYNLFRSAVFTLVFSLFSGVLLAQNYGLPINAPRLANDAGTQRMMCNNDAGVIESFGPFIGQSTDRGPDTIFLCLGDSVFVNHDDLSANFSGDPVPPTPAGIGYIPYRCPPTITGPTIADVATDACIANDGVFPPNGGIGFYIYVGDQTNQLSGDAWFFNDGTVQAFFPNAGSPDPIVLWQTPVTFDQISADGVSAEYERDALNVLGPCVNVSTDESFAIAYLNGITLTDVNLAGCSGSFRVRGGAPELLGGGYFIEARLTTDPTIVATVNSAGVSHDGFVTFEVPQPGNYEITIRDDKSCPASRIVTMDNCDAVTFIAPFENHLPGDNFCVSLTTQGFIAVTGFQFTITYDPTVLTYTGSQNNNPQIASLFFNGPPSSGGNQAPGVIRTLYASPVGAPETIADDAVISELCFTAIGQLGECSPITFGSNPLPVMVTVDDGAGGTTDSGFELNAGAICLSDDPFFVGLTQDSLSCPFAGDGCLNVVVSGGTAPYTVRYRRLSPIPTGILSTDILTDETDGISYCSLIAGEYEVEVLDDANQLIFDTIRVIEPIGFGVNVVTVSPTCFGLEDGTAQAVIRIGVNVVSDPVAAGYLFSWNTTTLNIDSLTGLTAEDFVGVTVTSPNGCTSPFVSGTVSPVTELEIRPAQEELAVDPATCAGSLDGSITVSAEGGTPDATNGYRYEWSHGPDVFAAAGNDVTVNGLDPGPFTVTVTDANGCMEEATYQVTPVKELSFVALISQIDCAGDDNGEIFVTGNTVINDPAETPDIPYTFAWSANAPAPVETATTTQITALEPGIYSITMTDTEGCMADSLFTVVEPEPLIISDVITLGESCDVGNDGSATVVVSGGTLPYTFEWSNTADIDSIAQGLSASINNRILVTDGNGCTQEAFFDILAPTPPQITQFDDDFVSCPEATDGELTVIATPSGAPIAEYSWEGPSGPLGSGPTTTTISNLAPGTYYVTITDQNSCFIVDSALVISPGLVVLDSMQLGLPTCVGESDGRIRVFPSGGTPPYTFTWSNNPNEPGTLNPLTGLGSGTYSVTIQDSEGCDPLIETIVLPDPPSIVTTFSNVQGVSCPDDTTCDGSATVAAVYSDGTNGSFNFVWRDQDGTTLLTETGLTSSSISALCRGNLSVDVSDGSCGVSADTIISSPEEIVIGVTIDNVSCFQRVDGEITLNPTGGTAPFDFFWTETGGMTNMETDLAAGIYNVIVTDANGCARAQAAEVTEPTELILEIDPTRTTPTVLCADDENGTIGVQVTDPNGTNPLLPAPYTWQNGVAGPESSLAENLAPGTYSVTVTDIKGCTDELVYTIGNPLPIIFSVLPIEEPLCFGETTLVLIDTAFGGSGQSIDDFTFSVNNDGFQIPATQAGSTFAGQTVVTVFDDSGCTVRDTFNVNQPPPILVDLPESIVIELGDSLTMLNPIISPAGDIYEYLWTPGEFLSSDSVRSPTIFPFENRDYTLLVTNANGCQAFADIFVEVDANRNVYIPNVFSPNRDGRNEDFRIYACQGVQAVNFVRVFDRWGGQIFEGDNIQPNCLDGIRLWDGTFRGKPVDPGVFVYMIEVEFLDGATLLYRGDITVLR